METAQTVVSQNVKTQLNAANRVRAFVVCVLMKAPICLVRREKFAGEVHVSIQSLAKSATPKAPAPTMASVVLMDAV